MSFQLFVLITIKNIFNIIKNIYFTEISLNYWKNQIIHDLPNILSIIYSYDAKKTYKQLFGIARFSIYIISFFIFLSPTIIKICEI